MTDPNVPEGLILSEDGKLRCSWGTSAPGFAIYHDTEWGFPVHNEHKLFEKVCLEGFQSGLSWRTILDKRPAFREVFLDFNFEAVAKFGDADVERLMGDARIVRHRGKIKATINNAIRACEAVERHGSLGALLWSYEPKRQLQSVTQSDRVSKSPESERMAKELKKLGWKFFGPTTAYAFMQAMGLVNDHLDGCVVREACQHSREAFVRPTSTE